MQLYYDSFMLFYKYNMYHNVIILAKSAQVHWTYFYIRKLPWEASIIYYTYIHMHVRMHGCMYVHACIYDYIYA